MTHMIEVRGLRKSYGSIEAVKGIDFYMEKGALFAFLGPNGAGKSTTIDIITTFLEKDAGEVWIDGLVLGKENDKIRNRIGAVFQDNLLDRMLSVEENLQTRGALYGMSKQELYEAVERVIRLCELQDIRKQRYGRLSGGQRRRCDIARSILHQPRLLFLDEPTTGLDPQTRKMIWEMLCKLQRDAGMSIFLTTHYMEEAASADYVVVIDKGSISAKGTPIQLKERYAQDSLHLYTKDSRITTLLSEQGYSYQLHNEEIVLPLKTTMDALGVLTLCKDKVQDFEVLHGTMDDAFLAIIGKELSE